MLKIALDISALSLGFKEHSFRGIGRYVTELSKELSEIESEKVKVVNKSIFENINSKNIKLNKLISKIPYGQQTLNQQIVYPFYQKQLLKDFDYIHFPAHMDPPAFSFKPTIVTVLDLIPLVLKDLYQPGSGRIRYSFARFLEYQAIKNAKLILAISENTKKDLIKYLGIKEDKIIVTHLGVNSFFKTDTGQNKNFIKEEFKIPQERTVLFYHGGIDIRKNYDLMLKVIKEYNNNFDNKLHLVIAGKIEQEKNYPILLKLVNDLGLEEFITFTGFLKDKDLLASLISSDIYFFPSLYEGFGLPPLEAMAAGLPVISSNSSCLPEILGDSAMFFDPNNITQAVDCINNLYNNNDLRLKLIAKGRIQAQKFTWEMSAKSTLAAYESLIK